MPARHSELPARLYADLLPVPYTREGRTLHGLDCVGLFLVIQARIGNRIPQYGSDPSIVDVALADWQPLSEPEAGCAALFRSTDPPWHLGVVVGANTFVHAKENAGIVVERFDSPLYRRRLEGFYKWKAAPSVL